MKLLMTLAFSASFTLMTAATAGDCSGKKKGGDGKKDEPSITLIQAEDCGGDKCKKGDGAKKEDPALAGGGKCKKSDKCKKGDGAKKEDPALLACDGDGCKKGDGVKKAA